MGFEMLLLSLFQLNIILLGLLIKTFEQIALSSLLIVDYLLTTILLYVYSFSLSNLHLVNLRFESAIGFSLLRTYSALLQLSLLLHFCLFK